MLKIYLEATIRDPELEAEFLRCPQGPIPLGQVFRKQSAFLVEIKRESKTFKGYNKHREPVDMPTGEVMITAKLQTFIK